MIEINLRAKERPPFIVVILQECERMNIVLDILRISLIQLDAGLKGQLNITEAMESLSKSLSINKVPGTWGDPLIAYFSNKSL